MQLPNALLAKVGKEKLLDYCLNPAHEEGKHKALVFQSALGIGPKDWVLLRKEIRLAAGREEATFVRQVSFGSVYRLDFQMTHQGKTAKIRTGWIVRNGENFPRLTTCFIFKK